MFQDIFPHRFDNSFKARPAAAGDFVLAYAQNKVLLKDGQFPLAADLGSRDLVYLFSMDERAYYLERSEVSESDGFVYEDIFAFSGPDWQVFAVLVGSHLYKWYENNRFCGRCGSPYEHSQKERALVCPDCGQVIYPRISPVVIVGVTDGERLLMTKYRRGYGRYALVAGFAEFGESYEEAVKREVLEEVGLQVREISYFASQPWPHSESLLAGFFAKVDGDKSVTMDADELSEAVWLHRDEIPRDDSTFSLTWTMIEAFRDGTYLE